MTSETLIFIAPLFVINTAISICYKNPCSYTTKLGKPWEFINVVKNIKQTEKIEQTGRASKCDISSALDIYIYIIT